VRAPSPPAAAAKPAAKTIEPVIPLVQPPDDPGPDSSLEGDPVPETTAPRDAWQRIKELFR
jgi:hypothetical protein